MSVNFKNWQEICKKKDERIKELEEKFDLIVERLEKLKENAWDEEYQTMCDAIEIVKQVGGINE